MTFDSRASSRSTARCAPLIAVLAACSTDDAARFSGADAGVDARGGSPQDAPVPRDAATDGTPPADGGPGHVPEGGPAPDGAPDTPDAPWGFLPVDNVTGGARARGVEATFRVAEQAFASNRDGSSWLLWRGYEDPEFSGRQIHLDHFSPRGVLLRSSELAVEEASGLAVHPSGDVTVHRNRCDARGVDTCFFRETPAGARTEATWSVPERTLTQYRIDDGGNVAGTAQRAFTDRYATHLVADGEGLYALGHHGAHQVTRLGESYVPLWSRDVLPSVAPPDIPLDAPLEELLRAAELVAQLFAGPVAVDDGVVVAAAVSRGTLAALRPWANAELPLPDDPRCPDLIVAHLPASGGAPRYFGAPTPECEKNPELAVVEGHAVVASVLHLLKDPEPNDTRQYDVAVTVVNLEDGSVRHVRFAGTEDDVSYAVAPCGPHLACIGGQRGSESVDTGSVVTYGDGFIAPIDVRTAELGAVRTLTSPRHTEVRKLAPHPSGVLFFAIVDGPITHTADPDRWLGFNKGQLGLVEGL